MGLTGPTGTDGDPLNVSVTDCDAMECKSGATRRHAPTAGSDSSNDGLLLMMPWLSQLSLSLRFCDGLGREILADGSDEPGVKRR